MLGSRLLSFFVILLEFRWDGRILQVKVICRYEEDGQR